MFKPTKYIRIVSVLLLGIVSPFAFQNCGQISELSESSMEVTEIEHDDSGPHVPKEVAKAETTAQAVVLDRFQLSALLTDVFGPASATVVGTIRNDAVTFGAPCSIYESVRGGPAQDRCNPGTPNFDDAVTLAQETSVRQALIAHACQQLVLNNDTRRFALGQISTGAIPEASDANFVKAIRLFYRTQPEPDASLILSLQLLHRGAATNEEGWMNVLNAVCSSSYWQVL